MKGNECILYTAGSEFRRDAYLIFYIFLTSSIQNKSLLGARKNMIMGHCITALILKGSYDVELAKEYDLIGKEIGFDLTLFHIDHYYAAYWQFKFGLNGELSKSGDTGTLIFPTDRALAKLVKRVSTAASVEFAIIATDYFAGTGTQFASIYNNEELVSKSITKINQVLRHLGVKSIDGKDEFDSVGLDRIRSQPEILEKYLTFCDENNL